MDVKRRAAGLDEVGRGALAGAVLTAAVILPDPLPRLRGLKDSKQLTARQRHALAEEIKKVALGFALGRAEPSEIDAMNILKASLFAMSRALESLSPRPDIILVDGPYLPPTEIPGLALIRGDTLEPAISAAAILAKVRRDEEMTLADQLFPGYGFSRHKGYPTREHLQALERLGPCPLHRRSFGPVQRATRRAP